MNSIATKSWVERNHVDPLSSASSALRILLVSEPGVDGVFRHVEGLAHFLIRSGHEVHLAFSDVRGSDQLRRLVSEIVAAGGSTLNLAVGNAPQRGDARAFGRLWSLVRRIRPDVIHAHSSKAGALVRALPFTGVRERIFYTPHAYYGLAGRARPKAWFFNTIERLLGRIGTTIALSEGEKEFAITSLKVPANQLRLIPNPVDAMKFRPADAATKQRLRAGLGIPANAKVLGSVGRLAFQKDPQTLYRAFAAALGREPDLWLYHLGDGELSDECSRLAVDLGIANRLIRRLYLSEPETFYQAIDALILVSRYEGLSLAVLEALACGLPIILSEAPGNLDFVRMGLSHCWSAPVGAGESMAEAIQNWAADCPRERASNHRGMVETRFSEDVCFGALIREYENAISRTESAKAAR